MLPPLVMLLKKERLLRKKERKSRQSRARVGTWPRDDSYRHDYSAVDAVADGDCDYAGSGCDGGAGYGCCDTEDVHMHRIHLHYVGNAVDLTVADAVGSLAGKEEEAQERKDAGSGSPWQRLQMTETMTEWKTERSILWKWRRAGGCVLD